ncbi:condensation domain-containing protein [Gloeobacter kilaueensis]|uniref:Peptide synthase n=1 Tax=Gloeobacter kilaueensis (strain ATCC BAA-2537 / CCAP 1431/1 / ULC 316 / JS1) TaxID=1183438 RepID=U5QGH4_GLOK1|nr:condensation domain-containing protein [Gloeobacter kilaueensis]AGY58067.1 peptide synthase [Gloeobacter kilaueensis JS1]
MSGLPESLAHLPPEQQRALLAELLRRKAAAATSHPLSRGQRDLWLWYQISAQTSRTEFNVIFAWAIRSPLDVEALRRAFQTVVDRHAILRTVFGEQDGQPVQRVERQQPVHFNVTDATGWSAEQLRAELDERAHQRFELEKGPLLRADLFVGRAEPVLLLAIHHIAIDMWSLSILLDEVGQSYSAYRQGKAPVLPPLERQYPDFVRWHDQLLASTEGQRLRDYWQNALRSAQPVAQLPTDRPRPAVPVFSGACHAFTLEAELTERLKDLARQSRTTLYAVLMAAFQVLLFRYTRQEDLTVLTLTVGRQGADWAGVLGYFINPVALRTDLSDNPPFFTLLEQVHQRLMAALDHQLCPFSLVLESLSEPAPGEPRLTDIFFVFQKSHRFGMERVAPGREAASAIGVPAAGESGAQLVLGSGDLVLESFPLAWRANQRFVLQLMMVEAGGALSGVFQYAAELFDPATVARMATHLTVLLEGIVAAPQTPIAQLPLLSAAEQQPAPKRLTPDLRSRLQQALRKKESP